MTSTGRSSNARWSVRRAFQSVNTGDVVKATGNVGTLKIMSAESNFKRHYDDAKSAGQPDVFYAVAVRSPGQGSTLLLPLFIYGTKQDIQTEILRGLQQDSTNSNVILGQTAAQWAAIYRAALEGPGGTLTDRNIIYLSRADPNLPAEVIQNPAYQNLTKAGVLKDAERFSALIKDKGFDKKTATVRDTSRRIGGQRDPMYAKFFNMHSTKPRYQQLGLVISAKQNNTGPGKVEVKFLSEIKSSQAAGKLFPAGGEIRVYARGGREGDRSRAMNNILTFFTKLRADASADQQKGTYAATDVPINDMIMSLSSIIGALMAQGAQVNVGAFAGTGLSFSGAGTPATGAAGFGSFAPGSAGAAAFSSAPGFQQNGTPAQQFAAGQSQAGSQRSSPAGSQSQVGSQRVSPVGGQSQVGGQFGGFGGGAPGFQQSQQAAPSGFGGGAPSAMVAPPGVPVGGGGLSQQSSGFGSPSGGPAVQGGF